MHPTHALAAVTTFAAALAAAAPADAAGPPASASCRAQVVFACQKDCSFITGPADIALDFRKGTISYCRGSMCSDGKIKSWVEKGQWDGRGYVLFQATLDAKTGDRKSGEAELHGLL